MREQSSTHGQIIDRRAVINQLKESMGPWMDDEGSLDMVKMNKKKKSKRSSERQHMHHHHIIIEATTVFLLACEPKLRIHSLL